MEELIQETSVYQFKEVGMIYYSDEKKLKFYRVKDKTTPIKNKDMFKEIEQAKISKVWQRWQNEFYDVFM